MTAPEKDWPAFWSNLTPAEVAAALRAAPRVAREWSGTGRLFRAEARGSRIAAEVWQWFDDPTWFASVRDCERTEHATVEEAKAAADETLRAKGWVLL